LGPNHRATREVDTLVIEPAGTLIAGHGNPEGTSTIIDGTKIDFVPNSVTLANCSSRT